LRLNVEFKSVMTFGIFALKTSHLSDACGSFGCHLVIIKLWIFTGRMHFLAPTVALKALDYTQL